MAFTATSADAKLITTGACDDASLSQPFAGYGDHADYKLIPGGAFDGSLAGWSVSNGADLVDGADGGEDQAIALSPGENDHFGKIEHRPFDRPLARVRPVHCLR